MDFGTYAAIFWVMIALTFVAGLVWFCWRWRLAVWRLRHYNAQQRRGERRDGYWARRVEEYRQKWQRRY